MHRIYLAVSQEKNAPFITGGNEYEHMRALVGEVVPHLLFNGIGYSTNHDGMTTPKIIEQANRGRFDLYVSLNASASPEESECCLQGCDVFYQPGHNRGVIVARKLYDEMKEIYPYPELVTCRPSYEHMELRRSRAVSVYLNVAYRDNEHDAVWLTENRAEIGRSIAAGICNVFDIMFNPLHPYKYGHISINGGFLNVRSQPGTNSSIITRVFDGSRVLLLERRGLWCHVDINGIDGYVNSQYVVFDRDVKIKLG